MKKDNKIVSEFYRVYTVIITLIFLAMAFLKITKVYESVRFGEFAPIYATITLGIIGLIYLIIKRFSSKLANIIGTILYTFSSIILFIDCVYFSYMNKFTSVANLKLISFMGEIYDSIKEVNPLKYAWILIDIPIILIFELFINKRLFIFLSKKINYNFDIKKIKLVNAIVAILVIVAIIFYGNMIGFKLNHVKSENIVYHIRDFINITFDFDRKINYEDFFITKAVNKDENYGIAKGKNVVMIQVEALQNFVINKKYNDQEITPFLNSLIKENSFYFDNYFYQVGGGNTSDAEFTVNNSLLSTTTDASYMKYSQNTYYGLPHILKENGYTEANAYHAYNRNFWNREEAYVNQGFDNYYASGDYIVDEVIGLGLSDESFLEQVADKINEIEQPFYSFIITLSSHHPFKIDEEYRKVELKDEHKETLFGNYISSINYFDRALENFFEKVKNNGLYENSIFVIYGDHFGIANYNHPDAEIVSEMIENEYTYINMMNVPLIIHIPGLEKTETLSTVAGHVDVLPTLLHLLGIENNKAIMMGNDMFSVDENVVYEMMHVGNGSFITNDVFYYSSNSGIEVFNKAFDMKTRKSIEITNEMIKMSKKSIEFIKNARSLLNANKIIKSKVICDGN